jgi:hypothetical protein
MYPSSSSSPYSPILQLFDESQVIPPFLPCWKWLPINFWKPSKKKWVRESERKREREREREREQMRKCLL